MNPIILNYGRRSEFIQMLRERKVQEGVEIGTDHGQYAQQLLEGIPTLRLYCIDPWVAYTEGTEVHNQEEMDQMYEGVENKLAAYDCQIIRATSRVGVEYFADNSLDFVFIDGNHDFEHCYEDIVEWTKKVKPGGIIAGHDYKVDPVNNYGVIEAVQKYVKENKIAPLFIMRKGGKLVDCFMFFK